MQDSAPQTTPPHTGEGVATFSDQAGRRWRIKISVATVRALRCKFDIDLLKILDRQHNPFAALADDPLALCDVLWFLLSDQASEAGVAELDWLDSMAGDALSAAAYALMEATIDFFPQHRRTPLRAMLAKMRTAEASLTDRMTKLANSPQIDQTIAAELDQAESQATARLQAALTKPGN